MICNGVCTPREGFQFNIGLAIWRLNCFYETFVQGSTAGILLNFSAKSPPHRQAPKRQVVNQPYFLPKIEFFRKIN
jgi:hypothetical protein